MRSRTFLERLHEGLTPPGTKLADYPRRLNLACGLDYREGWVYADRYAPRADRRFDAFRLPWPLKDASFDYVLTAQFLEHVPPRIGEEDGLLSILDEIHRILRPGGLLSASVPYAGSHNDYENVTHYRHFVRRSLHFLDPERSRNANLSTQAPVTYKIHRVLVGRGIRLGRFFDSGYHVPKYLGFDPNVGRRRWLLFLLEKRAPANPKR